MEDSAIDGEPEGAPSIESPRERRLNAGYRSRVLAAALEIVRERGLNGLVIEEVRDRAKVSQTTFYAVVGGREGMRVAVLEEIVARVAEAMKQTFQTGTRGDWRGGVRAGLQTLVAFIEAEPRWGTALMVEALAGGADVLAYRAQVLELLVRFIESGRAQEDRSGEPLALSGEWVLAGMLGVIHGRIALVGPGKTASRLQGLVNPLTALAIEPYVGRAAAREELTGDPLRVERTWERELEDPLAGLGRRMTYRTLRVLSTIADWTPAHGGSNPSNREVAERAGIASAGQVSKLLARLAEAGLIENTGPVKKGSAKAWRLTAKGEAVERALRGRE